MISMELTSPVSYTGRDIQKWAGMNEQTNDIALRLKKKYFSMKYPSNKIRSSFYFVNVTPSGGVLLRKDKSKSPKSLNHNTRAS